MSSSRCGAQLTLTLSPGAGGGARDRERARSRGVRGGYQHLEAAYAENQEVQSDLLLLGGRGIEVPRSVLREADRLGGLIYGLLRAEARG